MVTTKTRKTPREQALYAPRAPALNGKKKKTLKGHQKHWYLFFYNLSFGRSTGN